jgi:hypothetical protein
VRQCGYLKTTENKKVHRNEQLIDQKLRTKKKKKIRAQELCFAHRALTQKKSGFSQHLVALSANRHSKLSIQW